MQSEVLDVRELTHAYAGRCVLDLPRLKLRRGACCAVVGPSGCGKTTLLQLIAGLLTPSPGRVHVLGQDLAALDQRQRDRFRGRHVALIPQRCICCRRSASSTTCCWRSAWRESLSIARRRWPCSSVWASATARAQGPGA